MAAMRPVVLLSPSLCSKNMAFTFIPAEDKLALFLKRLANATSLVDLAHEFGMCASKAHYVMKHVTHTFLNVFGDEVRWPTRDEVLASVACFAKDHSCPGG
jgi:hypothetical protein